MPFRHATWFLLLLVPMIAVAFWPQYFSDVPHASFALHAHGLTASAWIVLAILQTWSVHSKRVSLHRNAGLALFVIVPLFAAGALLAMQSMAAKTLAGHPFYSKFGVFLGLDDAIAALAFLAFVGAALIHRRQVWLHSGYMLSTVLLVLPPIVTRLLPPLPIPGLPPFDVAYLTAELSAGVIAALLAWHYPKARRPFVTAAIVTIVQATLVETFGRTAIWAATFAAMIGIPAGSLAAFGVVLAAGLLWSAWRTPRAALRAA
jgi:hypothetical protein